LLEIDNAYLAGLYSYMSEKHIDELARQIGDEVCHQFKQFIYKGRD
jgi:hypothetical protein